MNHDEGDDLAIYLRAARVFEVTMVAAEASHNRRRIKVISPDRWER